jgi:hypothetical protein
MRATSYSRLAATVFAIVALLQSLRALAALPVLIGETALPVSASWVAFVVAADWHGWASTLRARNSPSLASQHL